MIVSTDLSTGRVGENGPCHCWLVRRSEQHLTNFGGWGGVSGAGIAGCFVIRHERSPAMADLHRPKKGTIADAPMRPLAAAYISKHIGWSSSRRFRLRSVKRQSHGHRRISRISGIPRQRQSRFAWVRCYLLRGNGCPLLCQSIKLSSKTRSSMLSRVNTLSATSMARGTDQLIRASFALGLP
jgi:hypothetical protein